MRIILTVRAAVAVAAFAAAGVGEAAGRYNLPSTAAQYLGHGFGAGYHATLVLGTPITNVQPRPRVKRVFHSPRPPQHRHGFSESVSTLDARRLAPAAAAHTPVPAYTPTYHAAPSIQRAAPRQTAPRPAPPQRPQPRRPRAEPASPSEAPFPEPLPLPRPQPRQ